MRYHRVILVLDMLFLQVFYVLSAPEDHGRYYGGRSLHIGENPVVYGLAIVLTIFFCLI